MILDAAMLARGWLSVYTAADTDPNRPALYRSVDVEEHRHGLRLTSTDSYMILTAWVPERDHEDDPEPALDEMPDTVAVAIDEHQRAAGLLTHLLKLATADNAKPIDVDVRVGVPLETEDDTAVAFDGMEATAVIIDHPAHERVQLRTYDGGFPEWQRFLQRFKAQRTDVLALNADFLGRLAKISRYHNNKAEGVPTVKCRFGGSDKPVGVQLGSEPTIVGLLMPVRWNFDRDQPYAEPDRGDQQEM